ncbi:hypothetical protein R5H32_16110 [Defluviimonas sp. D31]|uniref:phage head spike fiber domain-containing protein n=1 Tax=Defluviimonas sp. D31 TaxID=3083253 RepID=UPI00296FF601|nr:hypothetical protein [Defluviimonas sp. D31]MDW4550887.1 hypothetical protein [Defluviimonas sp. D31]
MPAIFSKDYALPAGDRPLTHARIAHAGNWISGTASASSTDGSGAYFADAPANSLLFERWKPAALPGKWEIDAGGPVSVDYCAIGAHDLAATGSTLKVEYEGASRTNLFARSQELENAVWVKNGASASAGAVRAPDGSLTADKLVEDTSAGAPHRVYSTLAIAAETDYVLSVYVQAAGRSYGRLRAGTNIGFIEDLTFDLGAGTISGAPAGSAIEALPEGWFRISLPFRTQVGATALSGAGVYIWDTAAGGSGGGDNYAGDGVSGLHVWGFQLEAGTAPSSYIATTTAAVASPWRDLTPWAAITSAAPIFAIFPLRSARRWRIQVSGTTAPAIGFVRFGRALQFEERTRYPGRTPFELARNARVIGARSVTGEPLTRIKLRDGQGLAFSWSFLSEAWVKAELPAFVRALEADLFVIAERPGTHPEDVALCWISGEALPRPAAAGIADLHDFALNAEGYIDD